MSEGVWHTLGEAFTRVILAIGTYEDLGLEPGYEDIVRAIGRSSSRVRNIANELERKGLVEKVSENPVRLRLTQKGREIYDALKKEIYRKLGIDTKKILPPPEFVKEFDRMIYADSSSKKFFGHVVVTIDTVVPALKLPEVTRRLEEARGPSILYGLATELATAVQLASASRIGNVGFNELSRMVINVPIRVARVTEVSLPPHIEGAIIPLARARNILRATTIWPEQVTARDVISYAKEADALGLIKVVGALKKSEEEVYVEPRLKTGIDVIERISSIGFSVLTANPTRAWIPMLSIYGDVATEFPTVEDLLSGETSLLKTIRDIIGSSKIEKWVEHALGIRRSLNVPALAIEAPFKTFGVLKRVRIGDEERLLALTVARRIVGRSIRKDMSVDRIYEEVEKRIATIIINAGIYGNILREFIKEGYISSERAIDIVKKYANGNPEKILRDLEAFGFIQTIGDEYCSAWTISPIHNEDDETIRALLVWLSRTRRSISRRELYDDIIKELISKKEVSLANLAEPRNLVSVVRSLAMLEKMGIIDFINNDETIKVVNEKAKALLTIAYIGERLSVGISQSQIEAHEPSKKHDLGELIVDEIKKLPRS